MHPLVRLRNMLIRLDEAVQCPVSYCSMFATTTNPAWPQLVEAWKSLHTSVSIKSAHDNAASALKLVQSLDSPGYVAGEVMLNDIEDELQTFLDELNTYIR